MRVVVMAKRVTEYEVEVEAEFILETEELETEWGIPWWTLVSAGFVGGLVVLLAFFIVGTVVNL
jgi:hypothetical protein